MQVQWYLRNGAVRGQKRVFAVSYCDESRTVVASREKEIVDFEPFAKWKAPRMVDGMTLAECEIKWKEIIESPQTEAIFRCGVWLIPTFGGIQRTFEDGTEQATVTSRQADVTLSHPKSPQSHPKSP
jgi:hypothetical protein